VPVGVLVDCYVGQELLCPLDCPGFAGFQQVYGLDDLVLDPLRGAGAGVAAIELGFVGLVVARCPIPLDCHGHMLPRERTSAAMTILSGSARTACRGPAGAGLFVVAEEVLSVAAAQEEGEAVQVGAEGVRPVGGVADERQE
jgi:hypothetical protein